MDMLKIIQKYKINKINNKKNQKIVKDINNKLKAILKMKYNYKIMEILIIKNQKIIKDINNKLMLILVMIQKYKVILLKIIIPDLKLVTKIDKKQ